jgi:16S rRNA pseudouridine516 synthase
VPRLDKLIARNTGLSRKQVTKLLRAGRVRDGAGERLDDGALPLTPSDLPREIAIDDQALVLRHRHHVIQHKPVGVVTALRDGRHPTAYELLRDEPLYPELRPVGRLDRDCSGLLLWTTEGDLVHKLAHPKYAVPREYQVALTRGFSELPEDLVLEDGHRPRITALAELDRADAHPALLVPEETAALATIELIGGRFHEVKRIFLALGSEVIGLARVRYGDVELPPELDAGACVEIDLWERFSGLSPER